MTGTGPENAAQVGVDQNIVGEITRFDVNDNKLNVFIQEEGAIDLNGDEQANDTLIGLFTVDDIMCMCDAADGVCSANCKKVYTGEIAYIDFYDKDRVYEDDWANSVMVVGSDGGILDDEDESDTLWLPNGGDEIVVDYGSDDEITAVEICHPKTKVYQTYFIGTGKGEITTIHSNNNKVINNKVNSNNRNGIYLKYSSNNTLQGNKILNNRIGIYSEISNSIINSNTVCRNIELDFNSYDWLLSSGDNNTCDNADGWNETVGGCTNNCLQEEFDCDLNHDGIYIQDYNDLMTAYRCVLEIETNCNNYYPNWNLMKSEYNCFTNNIEN